MKRLAIITTHPIQYNAPLFRLLAERKIIKIKVFYTWSQAEHKEKFDPGFGKVVAWDIPLLDGYDYTFVKNISKNPGSKTYKGIQNPTLIEQINSWQPDAVLVFGWKFKSHLKALRYYHKNKVPVLFRGDSTTLDDRPGIRNRLRYLWLQRVYSNITFALYPGIEARKYFLKCGVGEDRLRFAPHAVENNRFAQAPKASDIREKLGIPESHFVFLFAGKLERKKNPAMLAQIFSNAGLDETHLLFVGNGPLEFELKERYKHRQIHFVDFQNQQAMPSVYSAADVFILPSQGPGETWGLAVNEAMAAGKAVLVSDVCGCAVDLVEEGVTGYTFKNGDARDLQQKLEMMAVDKNALATMGKKAGEKIKDWSFAHIAKAIERVMENIPDQSPE